MKTQLKIALLLITASVFMLLFFGGSIYYFLYNYSFEDFYKRLKTRATIAAQYTFEADKINAESFKLIRERHLEKLEEEKEYFYTLDSDNTLKDIVQSSSLPKHFIQDILNNGICNLKKGDTFYTGIKYNGFKNEHIIIVSAKNYYASHHLLFMRNVILIGIICLMSIVVYLSFYFSEHIFDPIKKITDEVKEISSENIQ